MEHTFARDYLNRMGIEIHRGGKRILTPVGKFNFEFPTKNTTGFWTTGDVVLERKLEKITSMAPLRDIGYGITSFKLDKSRKRSNKYVYKIYMIVKLGQKCKYVRLPPNHYVLHDLANQELRLVGPNAGPNGFSVNWIKLKQKKVGKKHEPSSIFDIISKSDSIVDNYKKGLLGADHKEYINIPEIPFMISDANEIVCIPQMRDEPRIGIWGTSGNGKTFLTHSILSRAFWKPNWNVNLVLLNDKQKETGGWSLPNKEFELELRRLNEEPRPLPTVHLHPHTNDTGDIIHKSSGTGFEVSLPFEEIMLNPHKYFEDLKGTAKYFGIRKRDMLKCDNVDAMMDIFMGPDDEPSLRKPPESSITKMRAILEDLYAKQIVDQWNSIPSKWGVKVGDYKQEYNPITACIVAGIVPVFVTSNLLKKGYFPQYFQYFANDIYDKHQNDPYFKQHKIRTWVVTDEILSIAEVGMNNEAADALETLQTQGRFHRIGSIVATQNYSKIQPRIKTNCNYIISFATPEGGSIASDYSMDRADGKRIKKLKKFECVAYTYDDFIVYDMDGNKEKRKGPIFGTALPPLSKHEAPT